MAQKVTKDTYALEPVGLTADDDTMVRRQVFAGATVPDTWELEDGGEEAPDMSQGLGAAPHAYKHQVDEETGKVKDDELEGVDTEATRPSARGQKGPARGRKPAARPSGD